MRNVHNVHSFRADCGATITWITPIDAQASSLHKRHNDEAYKVKVDQGFGSRYVVGRRQSTREEQLPPEYYLPANPYTADSPNAQMFEILVIKIDKLTNLVKMILIRNFDKDGNGVRKEPHPGYNDMWWGEHDGNVNSNRKNLVQYAANDMLRRQIPYEEDDVSVVKESRLANEEET
ncbi:uncharacterized protein LOC107264231 isoform X2 [Cephus cinctus]|uniref:Uncharacterized protein LOC107264231 isoform X2 n=1 Tax=Cephus cinctus TaxID=211228 RepID=A0AAJ7FEG5_CEPCN|nr:uncharacterized protein LOC107264231 isoform X2 [Cephus cinctus]